MINNEVLIEAKVEREPEAPRVGGPGWGNVW